MIDIPGYAAAMRKFDATTNKWWSEDYTALFRRGHFNTQVDRPLVPIADPQLILDTRLSTMSGEALRKFAKDLGLNVVEPPVPTIADDELERLDAMIEEASK